MRIFQPNVQKLAFRNDIEGLIRAAQHRDPEIRRSAISALAGCRGPSVLSTLLRSLRDENRSVRLECIRALGKLKDPSSVQPLEWAVKDPDPFVRLNVIRALGEIGGSEVVHSLILCMADPDRGVRVKAVETVLSLGKLALPELKKEINGGNHLIRRNVINVLGRMKELELVPQLIHALSDPVPAVRGNAIWALGRIGDPRAVPPLEGIRSTRAKNALRQIREGPDWRTVAENYEKAGRFEDAAELFEMKGEYEEAGRLRNKAKAMLQPHGFPYIMAGSLKMSSDTIIKDSVIQRSRIGAGEAREDAGVGKGKAGEGDKKGEKREGMKYENGEQEGYRVCPLCGAELRFDRMPRFCPYCAERLD
ncbi:MAG: HEAT repeat domain-containing protein [Thermoplasmata archaeon]|nr:HEAT repeat domain-containing protein [Thermoplasmata archaeon]